MTEYPSSLEAAPVDDGNKEFPMSLDRFAALVHGTEHEVWLHWMKKRHGREAHTEAGWHNLIKKYHNVPAHPSVLGG